MRYSSHFRFVDRLGPRAKVLLAHIACWVFYGPVQAATLDLTIKEHGGDPLARQVVVLQLEGGLEALRGQPQEYIRQQLALRRVNHRTDGSGRVRIEGLLPGNYTVKLPTLPRHLLRPDRNPLAPLPKLTLSKIDEVAAVDIEVYRGVEVAVAVDVPVDVDGFQARFFHPASGIERHAYVLNDGTPTVRKLPRGIWNVEVRAPHGFILVEVLKDRQDWVGHQVVLDLISESDRQDLVFAFRAPIEVTGQVSEIGSHRPAVRLRATLLEPGDWHAAALTRGIQIPEQVEVGLDDRERYEMWLPEGRWQLQPVGEGLISSDPPSDVRRVTGNDYWQQDFLVETEPPEDRPETLFRARVRDAAGGAKEGAVGAVFESEGNLDSTGRLLWSGATQFGDIIARGVPEGELLAVAGHEDTLEGRLLVDFDPSDKDAAFPEVVLPAGASIEMQAQSLNGGRLSGLQLVVERLDELPTLLLPDESFRQAKLGRRLRSDLAGFARASGFYAGRYGLAARLAGDRQLMGIAEIYVDGKWVTAAEVDLEADQVLEIEARERPAARLTARLECSDDWQLPETAAVRLLGVYDLEAPPLFEKEVRLRGKRGDELAIGPLEPNTYAVGLRLEGFDRWTWVYGAATPEEAEGVLVEGGDGRNRRAVDMGPLQVECGPAVDLFPKAADGSGFPPLRDLRLSARSLSAVDGKGLAELRLRAESRHLELRGMPRGEQELEITLEHPWFLPGPELIWQLPTELERGMYLQMELEVEALGGAVDVREIPRSVTVIRAVRGDWVTPWQPVRQGRALIPSLLPGVWKIQGCEAEECASVQPLGEIEVARAMTGLLMASEN